MLSSGVIGREPNLRGGEDVIIEINSNLRENKLFKRLFEIFLQYNIKHDIIRSVKLSYKKHVAGFCQSKVPEQSG